MVTADLIIPDLKVTSKKQAFRAIAEAMVPVIGGAPDLLFDALIARERIGSTGIGAGVAIPHVKLPHISRIYGVLTRLGTPVDYDAVDGLDVDIIFMLLVPEDSKTTQHLKILAQISRFLKNEDTCQALRATAEEQRISDLLAEWTRAQAAA